MNTRTIIICAASATLANAAAAQTLNTWVGGETGSWFEPTNWSEGRIPSASDRAVINAAGADVRVAIDNGDAVARSVEIGPPDGTGALPFGDEIRLNNATLTTTGESLLDGVIRSGFGAIDGGTELTGGTWRGAGGVVWAGGSAPGTNQSLLLRDLTWGVDQANVSTGRRLILEACTLEAGASLRAVQPGSTIEIDRRISGDGTLVVAGRLQGLDNDQRAILKGINVEARSGASLAYLAIDDGSLLRVVADPLAQTAGTQPPVTIEGLVTAPDSAIEITEDQTLAMLFDDYRIRGVLRLEPGASAIGNGGFAVLASTGAVGRLEVPASAATPPVRVEGSAFLPFPTVVSIQGELEPGAMVPVVAALAGFEAVTAAIEADSQTGFGPVWSVGPTVAAVTPRCLADTNGDGAVTPADFNAWVVAFNTTADACDQNGDRSCDPADFNAWVLNFTAGCL